MVGRPNPAAGPPSHLQKSGRRATAILVLVVGVVALGAGLAVALGDAGHVEPSPTPGSAAAPASVDDGLLLVPVDGTPIPATSHDAAASARASTGETPTTTTGIRAQRIRIERLGIDLRIVEGDGIDAPINKAAHYPGSAWPGGGSNIYLYGHARERMFLRLWDAREGDVVELDLVDGTTRTYVVDRVLPKIPWDAVEYLEATEDEQLTLQTSTSYHPTSPRFIIIAHPTS